MPCFLIKKKYAEALCDKTKKKEGRFGYNSDMVSRVKVGSTITFQNWTIVFWWIVTTVNVHACAGDALKTYGYKQYIPHASNYLESLKEYFLISTKPNKNFVVTDTDVLNIAMGYKNKKQ